MSSKFGHVYKIVSEVGKLQLLILIHGGCRQWWVVCCCRIVAHKQSLYITRNEIVLCNEKGLAPFAIIIDGKPLPSLVKPDVKTFYLTPWLGMASSPNENCSFLFRTLIRSSKDLSDIKQRLFGIKKLSLLKSNY